MATVKITTTNLTATAAGEQNRPPIQRQPGPTSSLSLFSLPVFSLSLRSWSLRSLPLRSLPLIALMLQLQPSAALAQTGASGWDCKQITTADKTQWHCGAADKTPAAITSSSVANRQPISATGNIAADSPHAQVTPIDHRNLAKQDWQRLPQIPTAPNTMATLTAAELARAHYYCGGYYLNPVPQPSNTALTGATQQSTLPIEASAGSTSMQKGVAVFENNVLVTQGSTSLQADKASYADQTGQVELTGNVVVRNNSAAFGGSSASINLQQSSSVIRDANYIVHQQHIRGAANSISASSDGKIHIEQGSYTQCSPDSTLWLIDADSIRLNQNAGQGSARHAKLKIKGVPVAYLPYARFPIGDQRQSGFLFPSLSDSSSGIDITVPYYFNIASNIDATLAPRYNAKRGYITEAEARWLNRFDQWTISGAYIGNDSEYADTAAIQLANKDARRWVVDIKERGQLSDRLFSRIDYTRISDNDYLRDLNTTSLAVNRTTHLNQSAALDYLGDTLSAGVNMRQYQTIDNGAAATRPFETAPEVWLAYQSQPVAFRLGADAQLRYSAFDHENLNAGDRSYGEFNLRYPMRWRGLNLAPAIGIAHIDYQLDSAASITDNSPSTSAPQAQIKLDMVFEKHRGNRRSTLEPGIFYLYRDADNQTDFPIFDSALLTRNQNMLTRDSAFSGYDRLEDTNQVAAYISHRRFDSQGRETLAATLGQISYFDDESPNSSSLARRDSGQKSSAIVSDIDARLGQQWHSRATVLWNPNGNQLEEGSFSLRYRGKTRGENRAGTIANLGYHYRLADKRLRLLQKDIEQADLSFVTPISKRWALIGRFQYDTTADRSNETLGGIEYNSCCVKWRVVYRDGLVYNGALSTTNGMSTERDRSLFLQIELKGLFGIGNSVENILDEAIRGYRTPKRKNSIYSADYNSVDSSQHTSF